MAGKKSAFSADEFVIKRKAIPEQEIEVLSDVSAEEKHIPELKTDDSDAVGLYPAQERSTQGRKGQKLQRINMAFQPAHLEHIQLMSRISGVSITAYVNKLIAEDMEKKADIVAQAKAFLK